MAGELDTMELLNQRYSDLEDQWQTIRAQRNEEVNNRVNQLANAPMPNPWIAAGVAGLYGADPFRAYQQAQMIPQAYGAERYNTLNTNLSEQEKEIAELMKSVQNRMTSKDALGYDYESKVFGNNFIVTNRKTGVPFVMGVDQAPLYMARVKQYVDELSKVGGMDVNTIRSRANEMAQNDLLSGNAASRDLTGMTSGMQVGTPQPGITPPTEAMPTPPAPSTAPVIDKARLQRNLEEAKNIQAAAPTKEAKAILGNEIAAIEAELKGEQPPTVDMNWRGGPVPKAPTASVDMGFVPTPEQKKLREQQYQDYAKQYTSDLEAIAGLQNMAPAIEAMKAVLANPDIKATSGPLHEQLTQIGGLLNYIDPQSTLAKSVSITPAYFSNMMNLVRDKIKALGSGTAISNLDFIVTQKSVGDLRNTPEGNKKLIALMELQNASMMDRLQNKVGYFESTRNGYKGYETYAKKRGNDPTHIIRRNPNTGDYYIQTKSDWVAEQAKANNVKPEVIEKHWRSQANLATKKLLSGTSISYGGK